MKKIFTAFVIMSAFSANCAMAQYQPPYNHGRNGSGGYSNYNRGSSSYPSRVFYGGNTYQRVTPLPVPSYRPRYPSYGSYGNRGYSSYYYYSTPYEVLVPVPVPYSLWP